MNFYDFWISQPSDLRDNSGNVSVKDKRFFRLAPSLHQQLITLFYEQSCNSKLGQRPNYTQLAPIDDVRGHRHARIDQMECDRMFKKPLPPRVPIAMRMRSQQASPIQNARSFYNFGPV